jgi:hypothetical protein
MTLANYVSLSRTFFLHSNPTATKTIYLDFNSHVTTNTAWNRQTGRSSIISPSFDFDNSPNVFSNAELERIQYIWQRVAEDFAPFNIDVTTQDPGEAALANTGVGEGGEGGIDDRWGVRVVIGGSYKDWYKYSSNSIGFTGTFGDASYGSVFVFSADLGKGNEKYTSEAISNALGCSLGLRRDGTKAVSSFKGHGNWSSIMGSGYYRNITQWSQGEYANASNKQDDLSIISSEHNGAGYRSDDFGNNAAEATPLSGTSLNQFGIISTRNDSDWFSFSTGAGAISISIDNVCKVWVDNELGGYNTALLFGRSPNLDISSSLYDSTGDLVASSSPSGAMSASFNLTLEAGTYYLVVDGVGSGDPLRNGYSDYGSLGQYLITGTIVPD